MWGDELQAWGLTRASHSPWDLYLNLEDEGHPVLWYALLYPLTRLGPSPGWMQVLNWLLVVGFLWLLWDKSPFSAQEKSLISLSYPLIYDYSVVSRCYGAGVLLLFGFAALSPRLDRRYWVAWLLLGALVNTHFFFFLASVAVGGVWLWWGEFKPKLTGVGWYLAATVFAAVTMVRRMLVKEEYGGVPWILDLGENRFLAKVAAWATGFCPLTDLLSWSYFDPQLPPISGLVVALALVLLIGSYLKPQPPLVLAFFTLSATMIAFSYLLLGGHSWHTGVVFVTLLTLVWMARDRGLQLGPSWILTVLLLLNAAGGLKATVGSHYLPLSAARQTATWIREQGLEDEFWIGYPAFPTFTVAVLLDRQFYFPGSNEKSSYIRWLKLRMTAEELPQRILNAIEQERRNRSYLIVLEGSLKLPTWLALDQKVTLTEVARFSQSHFERFIIYRLETRAPPPQPGDRS